MNKETADFIRFHREEDVRGLALKSARLQDVDMPLALEQIEGWQKARTKLPSWAATDGLLFPPHLSMEQCSSELTARYKAQLAMRLVGKGGVTDLTGGFGVDFSFIASQTDSRRSVYVERQPRLCEVARHNFSLLGLTGAEVVCGDGVEYLHAMNNVPLIYLDPARRDTNGSKTYAISDCTPDVLETGSEMLSKADYVIVKLSPMLDITASVKDLNAALKGVGHVAEVHVVSAGNECKELLFVLSRTDTTTPMHVYCVNDDTVFDYSVYDTPSSCATFMGSLVGGLSLYEPNASIMKAGCFAGLCRRYGIEALDPNSHLFVGQADIAARFPGRSFRIDTVTTMNKKELRTSLSGIDRANVAVRNFPMSAADLRRRLKLKDGGDVYIFGTTSKGGHILLICHKAET